MGKAGRRPEPGCQPRARAAATWQPPEPHAPEVAPLSGALSCGDAYGFLLDVASEWEHPEGMATRRDERPDSFPESSLPIVLWRTGVAMGSRTWLAAMMAV